MVEFSNATIINMMQEAQKIICDVNSYRASINLGTSEDVSEIIASVDDTIKFIVN